MMKIYKTEQFFEKGKSIHVFKTRNRTGEAPHVHEFIEIVYALSGSAVEIIDGVEYPVSRGDMFFINYGSDHAFRTEGEYEYVNICFSPETVGSRIIDQQNAFSILSLTAFNELCRDSEGGKLSFFGAERREIENILEAMLKENREKLDQSDRVLDCYMNIIITKMLRKTTLSVEAEDMDRMWRELLDYIDSNLDAKLTLSHLASKCFYNPSYFSRIFKEKFNMPLTEYISRKRAESAGRLLLESDMSVDLICSRVGFSDRSTFYHTFSKYMGCTPSEYRKRSSR